MGEGRTPGGVGAGGVTEGADGGFEASSPAGARESATLRLRKAILVILEGESRHVGKCGGTIDKPTSARRHLHLSSLTVEDPSILDIYIQG